MGFTGVVVERAGRVRCAEDRGELGGSMTSSEGGIRRPAAVRYSDLNLEAKSSSRPTNKPDTTRNSSILPVVNSRSP